MNFGAENGDVAVSEEALVVLHQPVGCGVVCIHSQSSLANGLAMGTESGYGAVPYGAFVVLHRLVGRGAVCIHSQSYLAPETAL